MSRLKQCKACPWKKSTVPDKDIPGGYCPTKHEHLSNTIAVPGDISRLAQPYIRMMACHEYSGGEEQPCVGWINHQLGRGNNIVLRLLARDGRFKDIQLDGEQHETFEDTLP